MALALKIDADNAWRYNKRLIDKYKSIGTNIDKEKINNFEDLLTRYAEQTLDWDKITGSIVADADDAASRANANLALDSFNKTRSDYHNRLINITTDLDNHFTKITNERFCNFPCDLSNKDLHTDFYRKNITDAAFSHYVSTHPNDRLDDKTIQSVRKMDLDLYSEIGGVEFRTSEKQMQQEFNKLDSPFKLATYRGYAMFIDVTPEAKSNFKLYSPLEVATTMNETQEYRQHSPYEQSVILASLIYSEATNGVVNMNELPHEKIAEINKADVTNIETLLGTSDIQNDVLSTSKILVSRWEDSRNNPYRKILANDDYKISNAITVPIEPDLTHSLNDLSSQGGMSRE